jgi:hypothetical protein
VFQHGTHQLVRRLLLLTFWKEMSVCLSLQVFSSKSTLRCWSGRDSHHELFIMAESLGADY